MQKAEGRNQVVMISASLHSAFCILHSAFCLLPSAFCLLHSRPKTKAPPNRAALIV